MNTNNERPSCSGALSAVRLSSNGKQVKATEVRFRNDVALRFNNFLTEVVSVTQGIQRLFFSASSQKKRQNCRVFWFFILLKSE